MLKILTVLVCSLSCLVLVKVSGKAPHTEHQIEAFDIGEAEFADVPGTPPNEGEFEAPSFDFVLSE